ncbi:MAG: hypothetical protein AABM66_13230 [Actinomycetota bacterium]
MQIGEVIAVDDAVSGFGSGHKEGRPCLVARIIGEPPELVYLVPRSATSPFGIPVPAGAAPGLNKPGKFLTSPLPVDAADLEGADSYGMLAEPYFTQVMDGLDTFLMDI